MRKYYFFKKKNLTIGGFIKTIDYLCNKVVSFIEKIHYYCMFIR